MENKRNNTYRKRKHQARKFRKKRRRRVYLIIFLLSSLALSFMWLAKGDKIKIVDFTSYQYEMVETNYKISLGRENKNMFYPLEKDGFYHVTKDKVTLYDKTLNRQWEDIHDYVNVECYQNGDNIVVYDIGSTKNVKVYGKNGIMYSISPTINVKKAKINKNGYVAIMYSENGTYYTNVYDDTGNVILMRIDDEEEIVFLDYDISNDNKYLIFSYLDLTSMNIKSNITFQYLNEEDSIINNTDNGVFSWFAKENELVGRISCIGDYVYVISDKELQKFSIDKNTVEEEMTLTFTNVINDIIVIQEKYFAISMGEEDMNEESYEPNTVVIFNELGKVLTELKFEKTPILIKPGIKSILVNIDNRIINYDIKGNRLWGFENGMLFSDFLLLGSNDEALVVDNTSGVIINKKLVETEKNEGLELEIDNQELISNESVEE